MNTNSNSRRLYVAPLMALLGVIVGSLISGFFTYSTQKRLIDHQEKIYKDNYSIEKNKDLRNDIESYLTDLSYIIVNEEDSIKIITTLRNMTATSLKISLLNDYNIGLNCLNLTDSIKNTILKGEYNDKIMKKDIVEWMLSIKSEMKIVDYTIDNESLERDLIQFIISGGIQDKK